MPRGEPVRSPSPETLARMSATGPAMSPSSRTQSFEHRRLSQPQLPSEVVADEEREAATSPARTRSPRPEADGRLDRKFRFPVAGSASGSGSPPNGRGSGSNGTRIQTNVSDGGASPAMQTPIVHIQAPSTDGPISAPVGYTPTEETESVKEEDEDNDDDTPKETEPVPADPPPSYDASSKGDKDQSVAPVEEVTDLVAKVSVADAPETENENKAENVEDKDKDDKETKETPADAAPAPDAAEATNANTNESEDGALDEIEL